MSWILNWMDQVWCVHSRSSGFLLYLVCREKLSGKKQLNVGWQFITKCNIFLKLSGWICEQNGVVDLQSKVQQMRFTFDRSIKSSPIATSATFFAAQQAAKWVIEFTCGGNPPCIIRILEIGYNFAFSCHSNLKTHCHICSGERPFYCGMYNKLFSRYSPLHTHQLTHSDLHSKSQSSGFGVRLKEQFVTCHMPHLCRTLQNTGVVCNC